MMTLEQASIFPLIELAKLSQASTASSFGDRVTALQFSTAVQAG